MRRLLVIPLVLALGCASTPLKQKISEGHQTVRAALTAFDDAELALCAPDATKLHCTNPAAAQAGLSDAIHAKIKDALVDAYTKDQAVSAAIIAWKSGDPKPSDLPTLLTDANAALGAVTQFAPNSGLLAKAKSFVDAVTQLEALLGAGK